MVASLLAEPEWFSVAGLAIDIVAMILLAWDLLIARKITPGGRDQNPPSSAWQGLRQEKMAVACVLLLALGFAMQIYGNWPR